jgi:hypothetical protein
MVPDPIGSVRASKDVAVEYICIALLFARIKYLHYLRKQVFFNKGYVANLSSCEKTGSWGKNHPPIGSDRDQVASSALLFAFSRCLFRFAVFDILRVPFITAISFSGLCVSLLGRDCGARVSSGIGMSACSSPPSPSSSTFLLRFLWCS